MARIEDRRKVIELRKIGKTYSEIRRILHVPKSTLSDWLSKYPLTQEQISILEKNQKRNKDLSIEKVIQTKKIKREKRLDILYKNGRKYWQALSKREAQVAGLFLYWGEGNKRLKGPVSLNNTDHAVLKFTLYWLRTVLEIPQEKIKAYLHLYEDMNIKKEIKFWSYELGLPLLQFIKPYIKKTKKIDIDQKGFGHGTCGLMVNNVRLKEKVMMEIKAISDIYGKK